jgi:hypothetical protein
MGRYDDRIIPDEELKRMEEEINVFGLDYEIQIKGKTIKTLGELKKYIKSMDTVYKLEDYLSNRNYSYIHRWFSEKLEKEENNNNI